MANEDVLKSLMSEPLQKNTKSRQNWKTVACEALNGTDFGEIVDLVDSSKARWSFKSSYHGGLWGMEFFPKSYILNFYLLETF